MSNVQRASELFRVMPTIRKFVSRSQIAVMAEGARGEERDHFISKMIELADTITNMPQSYQTDGQGDDATVHLHYFHGEFDWYITEKDMETDQHQAFGYADLGCPELGYISIEELKANGVELDLYWTPKTLGEVKAL